MRRRTCLFAGAAALALGVAAPALAELTQKGNLFVRFDGGIPPQALPRHTLGPIAVRVEGTIRTPPGQTPPDLRRIRVALNKGGTSAPAACPSARRAHSDVHSR